MPVTIEEEIVIRTQTTIAFYYFTKRSSLLLETGFGSAKGYRKMATEIFPIL